MVAGDVQHGGQSKMVLENSRYVLAAKGIGSPNSSSLLRMRIMVARALIKRVTIKNIELRPEDHKFAALHCQRRVGEKTQHAYQGIVSHVDSSCRYTARLYVVRSVCGLGSGPSALSYISQT